MAFFSLIMNWLFPEEPGRPIKDGCGDPTDFGEQFFGANSVHNPVFRQHCIFNDHLCDFTFSPSVAE